MVHKVLKIGTPGPPFRRLFRFSDTHMAPDGCGKDVP